MKCLSMNFKPIAELLVCVLLTSPCVSRFATAQTTTPDAVSTGNREETFSPEDSLCLTYQQFDQTSRAGWRYWASKGKYREAAKLVEQYLKRHSKLEKWQIVNLHFHAGQLYAFANDYKEARVHLKRSLVKKEPPNTPIKWNAYVSATIAFLDKDKKRLVRLRGEIARGPKWGDSIPNLNVVDSLLANLEKPYAKAYPSHEEHISGKTSNDGKQK